MKRVLTLTVGCFLVFQGAVLHAQTPAKVVLTGRRAQQLVSILVSGSDAIEAAVREQGATRIVVRDLTLDSAATYKYDDDSPYFELAVHSLEGKFGSAKEATQMGDATALYALFTALRLPVDADMRGSHFYFASVDCRINVAANIAAPERFRCTLISKY